MSITTCTCCLGDYHWIWEDAFNKFGFEDGDGLVMTPTVVKVITDAGYVVETRVWGLHNQLITSIRKDGVEQLPLDRIQLGYDDPRDYLPEDVVKALDEALPPLGRVEL